MISSGAETLMCCAPAFQLATQACGALGIEVAAKDHAHDLHAMRAAVTPRTRIVFIANPNNPTGTWLPARTRDSCARRSLFCGKRKNLSPSPDSFSDREEIKPAPRQYGDSGIDCERPTLRPNSLTRRCAGIMSFERAKYLDRS